MRRTRKHMLSVSRGTTLVSVFLISFLLFFGNILALVAYNVDNASEQVEQKLGIYFYLDDSIDEKDALYGEIIELLQDLKESGLQVTYFSKQRAFDLLSERLPNVINDLAKYGIENPLPPTIYVIFRNQEEFEVLKEIMLKYETVINNIGDLGQGFTFSQQEQRVSNIINMMNGVSMVAYFLILIVLVLIGAFISFVITLSFYRFRKQIEVEKLLGANYLKIQGPFFLQVLVLLLGACILNGVYLYTAYAKSTEYFLSVFQQSVNDVILPESGMFMFFLLQITILLIGGLVYSRVALWNLMRTE